MIFKRQENMAMKPLFRCWSVILLVLLSKSDASVEESSEEDCSEMKPKKPNIVFVLSDNTGWGDFSWTDETGIMQTPNMDELARSGVILNQTYVLPICTPTRAAFLTGRYPFRFGLGHRVIFPNQPSYLRRNESTLAEQLKQRGYNTHIVGKWHLGACREDVLPTSRGFDTHYGPWHGFIHYYTHDIPTSNVLNWENPETLALDFHDNTGAVIDKVGTHASELLQKRAVDIIGKHNPDVPMFLFMANLLAHQPYEVPEQYLQMYNETSVTGLREFRAMVTMFDDGIGKVVQALKDRGMWNNTILVVMNDNGGHQRFGSNWPLRGNLATAFEGGIRATGFIHSNLLHKTGYTNNELIHITDFFPTFLNLAGGNIDPQLQLDGMDVWDTLSEGKTSPRNGTILHYDTHVSSPCIAVRLGDYKLIDGRYDLISEFANIQTDRWVPKPEHVNPDIPDVLPIDKVATLLFNIKDDPREIHDLSESMPDIVEELRQYGADVTAGAPPPFFPDKEPEAANNIKGIWTANWC